MNNMNENKCPNVFLNGFWNNRLGIKDILIDSPQLLETQK